jgi:hypothetical protein
MLRFLLGLLLCASTTVYAQSAFVNVGIGPDIQVKSVAQGYDSTRFRMEVELGEKNFGFTIQPAFGNDAFSLFLGPRLMLPYQIGKQPLFIIPDFTVGPDFGFGHDTVGFAVDVKFGFRAFYEFREGMAISFRPFGMTLRPFNVWFGATPNQSQLSVTYEMSFGFAYFF